MTIQNLQDQGILVTSGQDYTTVTDGDSVFFSKGTYGFYFLPLDGAYFDFVVQGTIAGRLVTRRAALKDWYSASSGALSSNNEMSTFLSNLSAALNRV